MFFCGQCGLGLSTGVTLCPRCGAESEAPHVQGPLVISVPDKTQLSTNKSSLPSPLTSKTKSRRTLLVILLIIFLIGGTAIGATITIFIVKMTPPTPILTDEQQAQSVIDRYYTALNNADYRTAYGLWAKESSYQDFVSGFADTKRDEYQFGQISRQSDGTVQVNVTIVAISTSSQRKTYQGYYVVGKQPDGSWKIMAGELNVM
jgi:hypothetical protein